MNDFVQVSEARWINMQNVESVFDDGGVLSLHYLTPVAAHNSLSGYLFGQREEQFGGIARGRILAYLGKKFSHE
jgi:hypothetical protein